MIAGTSLDQVRRIAEALGPELCSQVVVLGGAACGLLLDNGIAQAPRPTDDVDLIVSVASKREYYELAKKLNGLGFLEDPDATVVCRFRKGDLVLDVMPTDPTVLGFSNRWYEYALESATALALPRESVDSPPVEVRIVSAACFIATKLEAFRGRGQGDLYHVDIEDIVTVIDGRATLSDELASEREDLREYVRGAMQELLEAGLEDKIAHHLFQDHSSQARAPLVVARCRRIAGAVPDPSRTTSPMPRAVVLWTIHVREGEISSFYVSCWFEPRQRALEPLFRGNQAIPAAAFTDVLRQAATLIWRSAQPTVEMHPDVERQRPYRRAIDHIARDQRPLDVDALPERLKWQRETELPIGTTAGPSEEIMVSDSMLGAIRALDAEASRVAAERIREALAAKVAWDQG